MTNHQNCQFHFFFTKNKPYALSFSSQNDVQAYSNAKMKCRKKITGKKFRRAKSFHYRSLLKGLLLNFASIFLLIWSICSLVSAMKECSFSLMKSNLISIAVLQIKLWFSGFDTRFHNFFKFQVFAHSSRFLVLSHYHVIDSSYII